MTMMRRFCHYPLCLVGWHAAPPPRYPHGPIVADCLCCGKTHYFYGLSVYGLGGPPILLPSPIKPIMQLSQ